MIDSRITDDNLRKEDNTKGNPSKIIRVDKFDYYMSSFKLYLFNNGYSKKDIDELDKIEFLNKLNKWLDSQIQFELQ